MNMSSKMNDKARNKSDLQKRIEQALKKTGGEDSSLKHALTFHLTNLRDSSIEDEIETKEELSKYLLSKMFMDKLELYPTQPFECQVDENSDWPLMPLPSEYFGDEKQSDKERKQWFYSSLSIGDILYCRVSGSLQYSYQLRVICKYGVIRLLEELQIMVELHHTKREVQILERPLLVCELVRVAVSKIDKDKDNIIIHVTVNPEFITFYRPIPRLGRISDTDLPLYILEHPDTEKYSCYSDYLNSKPQLNNPHCYKTLVKECGMDSIVPCSFFPEFNRKECREGQTGQAILKESKLSDVKRLANSALKTLERKEYDESLKLINQALEICPEKDSLMSKLYDIRSDIYFEQAKQGVCLKSLCNLERASNLSSVDDDVKQKFIHKLFKAANANFKEKRYKNAVAGYEQVLKLDESHSSATRALHRIKTKYAEQLLNLEEKSLVDLQEKKKELISELKKINP